MKKSNGKLVALIVTIVVVVAVISTGIALAATGALSKLFSSDKGKAFELLLQVPDKLVENPVSDASGRSELSSGIWENGVDLDYKISNIQGDGLKDAGMDLTGFSANVGLQMDFANKKAGGKISVEKNDSSLSAQGYASLKDQKIAFSLPELVSGKTFTMSAQDADSQDALKKIDEILELVPDLKESFTAYIDEQGNVLYEGAQCEKLDGGYRLTIPKETLDQVLQALNTYMTEQQDKWLTIENDLDISQGTITSSVSDAVSTLTENTQNFIVEVYGDSDTVTSAKFSFEKDGVTLQIQADFSENEEQKTAVLNLEVKENNESTGKITFSNQSKSGSACESHMKAECIIDGTEVFAVEAKETLDTQNSNAYTMDTTCKTNVNGDEVTNVVSGKGNIKNLEVGKCETLALDEVTVTTTYSMESVSLSYGMEMTFSLLEGDITQPSGEEVEVTSDNASTVLQSYATEAQTKLIEVLTNWDMVSGLSNLF